MIDPIISNLVNFGIAGCMAALVVWHVWFMQTRQIPTLLTTFEKQMAAERTNCQAMVNTERQITQLRHEENVKQQTLLLTSLRETHHAIRNLANSVKLHHARIDMALQIRASGFPDDDAGEVEKREADRSQQAG